MLSFRLTRQNQYVSRSRYLRRWQLEYSLETFLNEPGLTQKLESDSWILDQPGTIGLKKRSPTPSYAGSVYSTPIDYTTLELGMIINYSPQVTLEV